MAGAQGWMGVVAVAALLALPSAAAAPLQGQVASPHPFRVEGALAAWTDQGALDVTPAVRALSVHWASADGYEVARNRTFVKNPSGGEVSMWENGPLNRTLAFGAASLARLRCAGPLCAVLVLADGGGRLRMEGDAEGALVAREAADAVWSMRPHPARDGFYYERPAGAHVFGGNGTPLWGARASAEGSLVLFLRDVEGDVVDARTGRATALSLAATTQRAFPLGPEVETRRFAVLRLVDASLLVDADGVELTATRPEMSLDGRLAGRNVTGTLASGPERVVLADQDLALAGALALAPAADGSLRVEGEARELLVGGAALEPPGRAAVATGAVALLALLAALAYHAKHVLVAPLYSRLPKDALLEHPKRRAVYEAVARNPGATVAQVRALTGLGRMVVRHHVEILEQHRLLVSRARGRRRLLFLPSQGDDVEAAPRPALADPTRRDLADALLRASRGLRQRDLTELTGLSQRLVSYHLARLQAEGLVGSTGRVPRTYHATPRLRETLGEP